LSIILEFFSFNSYVLDFGLEGGVLGLGLGSCGLGLGLEVCVLGLALALGVMSLLTSLVHCNVWHKMYTHTHTFASYITCLFRNCNSFINQVKNKFVMTLKLNTGVIYVFVV